VRERERISCHVLYVVLCEDDDDDDDVFVVVTDDELVVICIQCTPSLIVIHALFIALHYVRSNRIYFNICRYKQLANSFYF